MIRFSPARSPMPWNRSPDMAAFWMALSRGVSLLIDEENSDRVVAAPPGLWAENAIHLPQMVATRRLAAPDLARAGGMQQDREHRRTGLAFLRPVDPAPARDPRRRRIGVCSTTLIPASRVAAQLGSCPASWKNRRRTPLRVPKDLARKSSSPEPEGRRNEGRGRNPPCSNRSCLGAAYQLGLVRAAVDWSADGRAIVQLSALGRYILAAGAAATAPSLVRALPLRSARTEIIAYRQGLAPSLIGQFSRLRSVVPGRAPPWNSS